MFKSLYLRRASTKFMVIPTSSPRPATAAPLASPPLPPPLRSAPPPPWFRCARRRYGCGDDLSSLSLMLKTGRSATAEEEVDDSAMSARRRFPSL
jgi:hypothetical protein